MRLLQRVIGLIFFLLVIGLGVMLLLAAWDADRWQTFLATAASMSRLEAAVGGACFVLLCLLYAMAALTPRRQPKVLRFEREDGVVTINTEIIAEYVANLAEEFPSIQRMRPQVDGRRNGRTIDIAVDIHVKASPQIHEICELLRQRVRENLATGLGITEVRHVVVNVSEIISEHRMS